MKKVLLFLAAIMFVLYYFDKQSNIKTNPRKKKVRFVESEELKSFDKDILQSTMEKDDDTLDSLQSFSLD